VKDLQDNEWHDAFLHKMEDGNYVIFQSLDEAVKYPRLFIEADNRAKYEEVKYNWNHGQPIVKTHKCTLVIVDNERVNRGFMSGGFKVISNEPNEF